MDKNNLILMLRYQLNRYKAMGDGAKCQSLTSELQRLMSNGSSASQAN